MEEYERMSKAQKDLEDFCKGYISEAAENLAGLVRLADKGMIMKEGPDGGIESGMSLTKDDLYCLVVKIPAECSYLQAKLNEQSIDQALSACLVEQDITGRILSYRSEPRGVCGDARERQRRAEHEEQNRLLAVQARKQIVKALTAQIERADKVYEGIKKVVDALNREARYDGKIC
jgi:hypothetical protein